MACDETTNMDKQEKQGLEENTTAKDSFTLPVLQVIKEAQQQHGLRHGDFQRYRQYCSRRLKRIRRVLHLPQGTKHRVQPRKLTEEKLKESKCLYLPLMEAERAWAYAMQLKSEANTEHRKRFHMLARLRKANKHADVLTQLCEADNRCDAHTKLEVQAYNTWMKGLLQFELEEWKKAMENFTKTKTIYDKLITAFTDDESKEIYRQKSDEISPNIRYCAYNIGDESAVADLMQMRLKIGEREDPLTSRLDELIEKTRERQSEMMSEVTWYGRTIPVKNEQVRVLLLSIQENLKQLSDSSTSTQQKLSLYESILSVLIEAQQSLKEELKDDPIFKAATRGQQVDGKVSNSVHLHTYLSYLRQTHTIERNLLLIDTLQETRQDEGKRNKPQDFARLYDVIIQSLSEIEHLPGLEEQSSLLSDVSVQMLCYKAFRCFYVAKTYELLKKWKEAIALYDKTQEYIQNSMIGFKKCTLERKDQSVAALEELKKEVDGLKYSVHAASILDMQSSDDKTTAVKNNTPLVERLDEYSEDHSLASKKPNLSHFPPEFQPIPGKPLFFDLALNLVEFPSLEDKMEQKEQQGGITGYFKGWLWGSKKKQ